MPSVSVNYTPDVSIGTRAYIAGSDPVCWVVVADSRLCKILQYHNRHFYLIQKIDQPQLYIDGLDNDGIGRGAALGAGRHNYEPSMEESRQAEISFAKETASWLEEQFTQHSYSSLVLVAAPLMLGELRKNLNGQVQEVVIAESSKNLTHVSMEELDAALLKIIPGPYKE